MEEVNPSLFGIFPKELVMIICKKLGFELFKMKIINKWLNSCLAELSCVNKFIEFVMAGKSEQLNNADAIYPTKFHVDEYYYEDMKIGFITDKYVCIIHTYAESIDEYVDMYFYHSDGHNCPIGKIRFCTCHGYSGYYNVAICCDDILIRDDGLFMYADIKKEGPFDERRIRENIRLPCLSETDKIYSDGVFYYYHASNNNVYCKVKIHNEHMKIEASVYTDDPLNTRYYDLCKRNKYDPVEVNKIRSKMNEYTLTPRIGCEATLNTRIGELRPLTEFTLNNKNDKPYIVKIKNDVYDVAVSGQYMWIIYNWCVHVRKL